MGITHGEALLLMATKAHPDAPWRWERWLSHVETFPPWLTSPVLLVHKRVGEKKVAVPVKLEKWTNEECIAVIGFLTSYRSMTTAKDRQVIPASGKKSEVGIIYGSSLTYRDFRMLTSYSASRCVSSE